MIIEDTSLNMTLAMITLCCACAYVIALFLLYHRSNHVLKRELMELRVNFETAPRQWVQAQPRNAGRVRTSKRPKKIELNVPQFGRYTLVVVQQLLVTSPAQFRNLQIDEQKKLEYKNALVSQGKTSAERFIFVGD